MGVNTAGQRLIFANAMQMLIDEKLDVTNAVLTQSYLRLEQAMLVGQTNIAFPILVNQSTGGQFATENRLQLQDAFVVSETGIFLFPAGANPSLNTVPLFSYPNTTFFTTTTAAAAETLYHGYLTLSVNKQVIVPFWDIWRSRLINQTQQSVAIAPGTVQDQLSGRDDVFYPTEPNWVVSGSRGNILTIVLPNSFTSVLAFARIVIMFRGVLAQNCTSVQ